MVDVLYDFGGNSVVPASMVEEEGGKQPLLPIGEYKYTVIGFNRKRTEKDGEKIKAGTWYAEVHFLIQSPDGQTATLKKKFFLTQNMAWMAGKALRSCGLRKEGEQIDFNLFETAKMQARTGMLKLKHRQGTGKYANETYNEIDDFLFPKDEDSSEDDMAF